MLEQTSGRFVALVTSAGALLCVRTSAGTQLLHLPTSNSEMIRWLRTHLGAEISQLRLLGRADDVDVWTARATGHGAGRWRWTEAPDETTTLVEVPASPDALVLAGLVPPAVAALLAATEADTLQLLHHTTAATLPALSTADEPSAPRRRRARR